MGGKSFVSLRECLCVWVRPLKTESRSDGNAGPMGSVYYM